MFCHKFVVGNICIESTNHIVAILPCIGNDRFEFMSPCFGIANQIEPVSCPTLAEMNRVEQSIDDLFECLR